MSMASQIRQKLEAGLSPHRIEIVDDSHLHAGHAGARPEGESHFRVTVVSPVFEGKSRVQQQRLVYDLLAEEMRGGIHALALTTLTPDQDDPGPPAV